MGGQRLAVLGLRGKWEGVKLVGSAGLRHQNEIGLFATGLT
jgi:hypothetical protein